MATSTVPLSDLMTLVSEPCRVDPQQSYPNLGIYGFARGVFSKPPIDGAKTSASTLYRVRKNQFIYSRLFAFEGAYAIVPEEMDGVFVSNEYPTFDVDHDRLLSRYLLWMFKRPDVWRQVAVGSKGMGDRRQRVHPEQVLGYRIVLPSLDEQRRFVARMDRVAQLLEAARNGLDVLARDRRALAVALACRPDLSAAEKLRSGWTRVTLADALRPGAEPVQVSPEDSYPNLGIYSYARGVFAKPPIDGATTSARVLYRVRAGQFIYSRLFAFEGAFAIVPADLDGAFVSSEFPPFDILPSDGAAFLRAYFSDARTWQSLQAGSLGLGSRRQRVNESHLLRHELWMPPDSERARLAKVLAALDRAGNSAIPEAMKALIPAMLHEVFNGRVKAA